MVMELVWKLCDQPAESSVVCIREVIEHVNDQGSSRKHEYYIGVYHNGKFFFNGPRKGDFFTHATVIDPAVTESSFDPETAKIVRPVSGPMGENNPWKLTATYYFVELPDEEFDRIVEEQ